MGDESIKPFKIHIPDSELDLLQQKLSLTRLPADDLLSWTEENQITPKYLRSILEFWRTRYSWRDEEERINATFDQFVTKILLDFDGFDEEGEGGLDVHFVHALSHPGSKGEGEGGVKEKIPLLFLHGWPGSFLEIEKALPALLADGFDVVAPSLPGYGFSAYPERRGFGHRQHARLLHRLMQRLGYERYVVQGGDWGSQIAHTLALLFPENVVAAHYNMALTPKVTFENGKEPTYTAHEKAHLERSYDYFISNNSAYSQIQAQRPITLGHAMHDSPMGLLSYIADKLVTWSDGYPWTETELITWTLMHYFPGPTTGFLMYTENNPAPMLTEGSWAQKYVTVPSGYTSLPKEIIMMPRSWIERFNNVVFYREHDRGGHFAMWEVPELIVPDCIEFYRGVWKSRT